MSDKNEQYYIGLSEIYIQAYEQRTKPSNRILLAMGVVESMYEELFLYRLKNGSNAKFDKQMERLKILDDVFGEFSVLADRNWQLRTLLQKRAREKQTLESEIAELQKQLNIYKNLIEEEQ